MKNELQIQNEIKDKIMINVRALLKPELFEKGFTYLISRFFDDLNTDELDSIDKFQVCQAMFISLIVGLAEEEDFENCLIVRKTYLILYKRILEEAQDRDTLEVLYESNKFYNEVIHEKLKY